MKYIPSKDRKEFITDLKLIYQAPNLEAAKDNLLKLDQKWGEKIVLLVIIGTTIGQNYPPIVSMTNL